MDKRRAITVAGVAQLEEAGLGSFTQARVAQRAGLRQSHLTYYFPTRSDLIVAVADEAVAARVEALRPVGEAGEPGAKVAALAAVLTAPGQTRVLLALTQSAEDEPGVRRALGDLAAGVAPGSVALLAAFGAAATASAIGLLQSVSTGMAVLALAREPGEFRPLAERMLTDFLTHLPPSDAEQ
ncbi:TetR family transcriptional regulator [Actinomycetospora sp.]|jgi:AcrR family transcriptional regulator|uniref:TetR family transcriptional regulator n=1 Tax=Actinomycetospora sp. TaxID=1872135 RepID=UPI002F3F6E9F